MWRNEHNTWYYNLSTIRRKTKQNVVSNKTTTNKTSYGFLYDEKVKFTKLTTVTLPKITYYELSVYGNGIVGEYATLLEAQGASKEFEITVDECPVISISEWPLNGSIPKAIVALAPGQSYKVGLRKYIRGSDTWIDEPREKSILDAIELFKKVNTNIDFLFKKEMGTLNHEIHELMGEV